MVNWKALSTIAFILGLGTFIVVIVLYTATGGETPFDYGIVLDAGSSHTGITLYKWSGDKSSDTGLVKQVATKRVKGGIAAYPNVTEVGSSLVEPLQKLIGESLPSDSLDKTPIYLGATAGMRLLNLSSSETVDTILQSIRESLANSTKLKIEQVGIISGTDEGLFSWITANYLSELLQTDSTAGMLDMGGASAQMAYEVPSSNSTSNESDQVDLKLYGISRSVKLTSNLCFGVDQALLRALSLLIKGSADVSKPIPNPCLNSNYTESFSGSSFTSNPCLETVNGSYFVQDDRNYTFTGSSQPEQCFKLIKDELLNLDHCKANFKQCFTKEPEKSKYLRDKSIIAISSYYYTARVLNLNEESRIEKNDYLKQTSEFCSLSMDQAESRPRVDPEFKSKYCFQLNYIGTTLEDVHSFKGDWTNIQFKENVKGASLGWSLGFMINATNAIPGEKPSPPLISAVPFAFLLLISLVLLACGLMFVLKSLKENRVESNKNELSYEPIRQQQV